MFERHHRLGVVASWLLASGLTLEVGCLSCCHPIDSPPSDVVECCQVVPRLGKCHVYVFMMNGLDPVNCANLTGLRDYIQALGFTKTYYGQLFHYYFYKSEICKIHQDDPEARFVLVGFCLGANSVQALAEQLGEEDIHVDLLVYLDGNLLKDEPSHCPENVERVINVLAEECLWNGPELEGAENLKLPNSGHYGAPSDKATLHVLAHELVQVAGKVPVRTTDDSSPIPPEERAPTPRPVNEQTSSKRDEWDFLKPGPRLQHLPDADVKPAPKAAIAAEPKPVKSANTNMETFKVSRTKQLPTKPKP